MNKEIASIFFEMAELLEMQEVAFKPRAYEKAAHSIEAMEEDVSEIYKKGGIKALEEIPGVGKGIAERIEEYIKTSHIKDYEKLKKKMPVDISGLTAVEGIGPQLIKTLYQKLKIKNIKDLEKAAKSGKLRKLPRFGEKLEKKILQSIEFHKKTGDRFILGDVLPLAQEIEKRIKKIEGVKNAVVAGSLRRWQETVGDIDILVIASNPEKVMDYFVSMPEVAHVYAKGKTKSMVRLRVGIDADIRVVPAQSFGAALQYFTGSKDHNVELRKIAIKKGYKLNEYGIFKGKKLVAGKTEKEVYQKLGLEWIPPELRLNLGEIELAKINKLPKLIELKDIRGDLQIQTDWTDGANSIEEFAAEAEKRGLEYIAVTDHTKSLAMTGGSDEKKLLKQMRKIDEINAKLKKRNSKFKIFKGAEVNIMKDGSLDIRDDILAKLDVVGAAIHSHFNLSEKEQTERLVKTMKNPNVDIVFHPTTRVINKRAPIALDMNEVFKAAKITGTLLEIDAYPNRLDLKDDHIRKTKEKGVIMVINTDAHSISHLRYIDYGVSQARRAGCEKRHILNTLSLEKLSALLRKPKNKRF